MKTCPKCNAQFPDGAKFCPNCGAKNETITAAPVQPQPVSQSSIPRPVQSDTMPQSSIPRPVQSDTMPQSSIPRPMHSNPMPQTSASGSVPPQRPPISPSYTPFTNAPKPKKSRNKLPLIIAGVVVVLLLAGIGIFMKSRVSGTDKTDTETAKEDSSTKEQSDSKETADTKTTDTKPVDEKTTDGEVRYYVVESMAEGSESFTREELVEFGMDAVGLEWKPDGTVQFYLYGEILPYEAQNGNLVCAGSEMVVEEQGDTLILTYESSQLTFVKTDSRPAFMDEAGMENTSGDEETNSAFVSPTTEIAIPSHWYGYARYYDFVGMESDEMIEDVWAVFDYEGDGVNPYFEVYETQDYDSAEEGPLLSVYVEEDTSWLLPKINDNDESAWFIDMILSSENVTEFSAPLENGALEINCTYQVEGVSFKVQIFLREEGTPWNEGVETLPPEYDTNYSE